ncbi:unnamed protein product [Cylicocyclus nassatus]|uniref:Uncharacterized protein n=1 Tax=Cylicocyclus nassatus TaxID=53992 RepID=A0AA36GPU5_CYLNA|nr:unnamed protein product [Cylicocyclus nassatus]
MWSHVTFWPSASLVAVYTLAVAPLIAQTVCLCLSRKKDEETTDLTEPVMMTAVMTPTVKSKESIEHNPAPTQLLSVSTPLMNNGSKVHRKELLEILGVVAVTTGGGRDPPKFPKKRRNIFHNDDSEAEETIYERRKKNKTESGSKLCSLVAQTKDLEVENTAQSPQKTQSYIEEDAGKIFNAERAKEKQSLFETVREWIEEQCTQHQLRDSNLETQSSPRRSKGRIHGITLINEKETAQEELPPDKTVRSPILTKASKESAEIGGREGAVETEITTSFQQEKKYVDQSTLNNLHAN